jgi:hypothetical protein
MCRQTAARSVNGAVCDDVRRTLGCHGDGWSRGDFLRKGIHLLQQLLRLGFDVERPNLDHTSAVADLVTPR